MTLPLRPQRGGFLRPFGCGWFIREFLLGKEPNGSPKIDPDVGSPQAVIFHHYKLSLMKAVALDRAIRLEDKITELANQLLARMPYKVHGCRYHSFVVYFSNLQRLGWVKFTGKEEASAFQDNYPPGPPRRYFRLTNAGRTAPDAAWSNPQFALYGES